MRRRHPPGDRVLFVEDRVTPERNGRRAVGWSTSAVPPGVGAAVVVDARQRPDLRRNLRVRSLLHVRDLP
jgi:adenine phosphoribosyltransferase